MRLLSNATSYRFVSTPGATSFTGNAPGGGTGVSSQNASYSAEPGTIVNVKAIDAALAAAYDWLVLDELGQGPTSERPVGPKLKGLRYYDTTIDAQLMYDNTRNQWYRTDTGELA